MSALSDSVNTALERQDELRALALSVMLTRLKVPVRGQSVLLASDRPGVYADRLREHGGAVFVHAPAALASAPEQPLPGAGGPFAVVLWPPRRAASPPRLD